jgi:transcription elongation factor Elf1
MPTSGKCPESGKHRHASAEAAKRELRKVSDKGLQQIYRCPHCASWHISHGRVTQKAKALKRRRLLPKED